MYTIYCYDESTDTYNENKHFSKLYRAEKYIEDARNDGRLWCKLYIRNEKRILKRYAKAEYSTTF